MTALQIEVGKTYKTESGRRVTLVWNDTDNRGPNGDYVFLDPGGYTYRKDGRSSYVYGRKYDLVEEVVDSSDSIFPLQAGKTYLTKDGERVGLIRRQIGVPINVGYPWHSTVRVDYNTALFYSDTGLSTSLFSDDDLVSLAPPLQIKRRCRYRDGKGEIVAFTDLRPNGSAHNAGFQFVDTNGVFFKPDGTSEKGPEYFLVDEIKDLSENFADPSADLLNYITEVKRLAESLGLTATIILS